ncbi:MAG TPA: hypothetical protein H9719_07630, partial [Candidatus Intestinimonas stercoravium]|nr:hypothetical protein [Candidatus Intestinimonas stercoravium]
MSFGIGLAGIIAALVFLTVAVYKGWSILYSSVISAIIIALTNGMDLYEALTVNYVSSFTSYAANYFILFCEGAMLGKLYDSSGAAWKIGKTVVDKCGTKFALVGYIAVAAILEYGGISTFVICFVLLPLAKPIFRETHTPWYMWPAITIVPIIGPELMTPGGLQSHNIIPTQVLGTDLMAAPVMGTVFTVAYFAICGVYFVWELKRAQKVAWKRDSLPPVDESDAAVNYESAPSMVAAVIPILAGVLLINFAKLQPIYGLGVSVILCIILFYRNIPTGKMVPTLNEGFANGVMPLIMVTAVVGIAQVVSSTDAFTVIRDSLLNFTSTSKVATAFSVVGITNIMALICGSASGAIAMTLEMFSDAWLAAGLDPEWIHRVVTTASGGFDTVPWNSFVVLILSMGKLTHKQAYMPVFWVSLVAPILIALLGVFFV